MKAIHKAVKAVGGQSALARAVHVTQPTVFYWLKNGVVPNHKIKEVSKASGVPESEFISDIFGEA